MLQVTDSTGVGLKNFSVISDSDSETSFSILKTKKMGWISEGQYNRRTSEKARYGLTGHDLVIAKLNVLCTDAELRKVEFETSGKAESLQIENNVSRNFIIGNESFQIKFDDSAVMDVFPHFSNRSDRIRKRLSFASFILLFLAISTALFMFVPEEEEEEKEIDPIEVSVQAPADAVNISQLSNESAMRKQSFFDFLSTDTSVNAQINKEQVQQEVKNQKVVKNINKNALVSDLSIQSSGKVTSRNGVKSGIQGKAGFGKVGAVGGTGDGLSRGLIGQKGLKAQGGLSKAQIAAAISKYLNQIRACYEQQLQIVPGLTGMVGVTFKINGSGGVNSSNVTKSTLNSPPVHSCITRKMLGWKFPKPRGGVSVNVFYPFMLRPVSM